MRFTKVITKIGKEPSVMKRSAAKLWIKIIILAIFGTLFTLSIHNDVTNGIIELQTLFVMFLPSFIIGIWLRKLVPVQIYKEFSQITFSFDRIYFAIILLLFIVKKTCQFMQVQLVFADFAMIIILGLMIGRIIGLIYRVAKLKRKFF